MLLIITVVSPTQQWCLSDLVAVTVTKYQSQKTRCNVPDEKHSVEKSIFAEMSVDIYNIKNLGFRITRILQILPADLVTRVISLSYSRYATLPIFWQVDCSALYTCKICSQQQIATSKQNWTACCQAGQHSSIVEHTKTQHLAQKPQHTYLSISCWTKLQSHHKSINRTK